MDNNNIYPDFANSLVNVPHTILDHFGMPHEKPSIPFTLEQMKGCSKVVLFLADGLGYNLWNEQADYNPFFKKIQERGLSRKITSVFPSSTPPALTSVSSGLAPMEHGLLEWNVYFRELGLILNTLPYSQVGNIDSAIQALPHNPKMLYKDKTLYDHLSEGGIASFYFLPQDHHPGVYTEAITSGATICLYASADDLMQKLQEMLETTEGKAYYYVYWDGVDVAEHNFSPDSQETRDAVAQLSDMISNGFVARLSPAMAETTAFLLTADHGQASIKWSLSPDEMFIPLIAAKVSELV